ncbi:MAG TPA: ribosome biogenesis factor YjgA [Methylotenera sp.]|nr:ribosome biogenesis factor YjgA [Methylotenera sp.]HPH05524.1 ribosome biogenesis factor YjgA [Methylotenera sp.]HPN00062.1 ribosome biogenesis factor YjgA [Methylotenera sp.]
MKPQITAKPKKTAKNTEYAPVDLDTDLPISKTKLKAEADAQQALGVRLCALSKEKLTKLDLPEALLEAVLENKKITANGAMRRHKQYLGRLMRDIDTSPIEEQLAKWDGKHTAENAYFHGLERWRDRLIADANVLNALITEYPQTDPLDIQQLRTLIRNAQKELLAGKPPKSSREIFKMLRTITQAPADYDDEDDKARLDAS